jgi:hypothetical protein
MRLYTDPLQSPIGIKAKFCDDHYEPPLALQAPENNRCHIACPASCPIESKANAKRGKQSMTGHVLPISAQGSFG